MQCPQCDSVFAVSTNLDFCACCGREPINRKGLNGVIISTTQVVTPSFADSPFADSNDFLKLSSDFAPKPAPQNVAAPVANTVTPQPQPSNQFFSDEPASPKKEAPPLPKKPAQPAQAQPVNYPIEHIPSFEAQFPSNDQFSASFPPVDLSKSAPAVVEPVKQPPTLPPKPRS